MTKRNCTLTQARLKEVLHYNPNTGVFTWRVSNCRVEKGDIAGWIYRSNGIDRRGIKIDGINYIAARLAWLYTYGEWPKKQVDHKNRDALDDRLGNLRLATKGENQANTKKYKHSKSPYRGITQRKNGRWVAQIGIDGVTNGLGTFDTPEEAAKVYDAAAKLRFGEFAQLNFSN